MSKNIRTMVQPALMTALKPESVGRPPGVAKMTPTADTELNVYTNIIDNSPSNPGANRTGRAKDGDAAPMPTASAKKKRESQPRLLSTDTSKKARRTLSAQTGDTLLGSRVTSHSDMKVTPRRRKYMQSSLQSLCYVERRSVEGGSTSILNLLALTYHFGQASATPERKRAAKITGHPPHPTVKKHVVNKEVRENVMSDASVWDVLGFHSRKREEDDRKPEARPTPSRRKVRDYSGNKKILKSPQTGGSPGVFFAREDESSGQREGSYERNWREQEHLRGILDDKFWGRRRRFLEDFF